MFFALWGVFFLFPARSAAQEHPGRPLRSGAPAPDEILYHAIHQEETPDLIHLRGVSRIETTETLIEADEIDYDRHTGWAYARGNVRFQSFVDGDKLQADHGEYNLQSDEGKFYVVSGTSPAKAGVRRGLLSTTNPFYFQGQWAERIKDQYILHNGFITDCRIKKPWWSVSAPMFNIIPDDRAVGRNAIFRIKHIPVLYSPIFYRPLGRNPRASGFLTPNAGNSSSRGLMFGGGYYWAINPSYDLGYRIQDFTKRGLTHTIDASGKPTENTSFNVYIYGVQDRGEVIGNTLFKAPGYTVEAKGKATDLPWGFEGRFDINYISSFLFRQTFSESYNEAISSEVNSIAYLQRHWDDYILNIVIKRNELYESTTPGDRDVIQKLPEVEFEGRDRQLLDGAIPFWFSFDSSTTLGRRQEPAFQTSNTLNRDDLYPRVTSALDLDGFHLIPSFALRETFYTDSFNANGQLSGNTLLRSAREFDLDIRTPTLARVFPLPKRLGKQVKHVLEPYAKFQYITGVDAFNRIIKLDADDLYSDTTQLEVGLVNHIYVKDKNGNIDEFANWTVKQARYWNPTFGGAFVPGERNVVESTEDLTAFAFMGTPRNFSPIVSDLRLSYLKFTAEWRADYDPVVGHMVASIVNAGYRFSQYFINVGHNDIHGDPTQLPSANQITTTFGFGNDLRRGWNAAASTTYDYERGILLYTTIQAAYNTDCCGFSGQFRRFEIGSRNENQWRFSFQLANIGAFGSLRQQDRIF
jgi:LPS-assembly protein